MSLNFFITYFKFHCVGVVLGTNKEHFSCVNAKCVNIAKCFRNYGYTYPFILPSHYNSLHANC